MKTTREKPQRKACGFSLPNRHNNGVRISILQVKSGNFHKTSYNKGRRGWGVSMSKQYDKQFKEDAVKYYLEHRELGLKNALGILLSAKPFITL